MTNQTRRTGVAGLAVLGLTIGALSASSLTSASSGRAAARKQLEPCPKTQPLAAAGGQPPPGAVSIPIAKSVAKSDTSSSIVINPTGPQIQCGKAGVTTYSNVVYSTPRTAANKPMALKMDVLVPQTRGKKPLVVWFSGGGFLGTDKGGSLDHRTCVAEANYVVASVQYRTIGDGATYPDGVADVKSAIRYLRAHAARYDIDPRKVAVWGESAGGYLAAMAGTTNGVKRFDLGGNLGQSSDVQAVVDQYGLSDLSKIGADLDAEFRKETAASGTNWAQWVFGPGTKKSIDDNPAAVGRANPATYVKSSDPPFELFHGSGDHLISPSQTLLLHNALRAKGVDSTRYVVLGANHGDLTFLGEPKAVLPWSTQNVMNLIVKFLDKHLKS